MGYTWGFMQNIISELHTLDFVLIGLMALGLIIGAKKGLAAMISKCLSLIGTILVVFYYYSQIASWLSESSPLPLRTAEAVVFTVISLAGLIVFNVVLKVLSKVIEVKFSDFLGRLGGFILGAVWIYALAGFVLFALLAFKAPFVKSESVSASYLAQAAIKVPPMLYKFVFSKAPPQPSI